MITATAPDTLFLRPDASIEARVAIEARLRRGYLRLDRAAEHGAPISARRRAATPVNPEAWAKFTQRLVTSSAQYLELMLLTVCAHEVLAEAYCDSGGAFGLTRLWQAVRTRSGLDPYRVAAEAGALFTKDYLRKLRDREPADHLPRVPLASLVRAVRAIVEACPVEQLEALGAGAGLAEAVHRVRGAYDALRAFTLRADPAAAARLDTLGGLYAQGQLTARQVASLLEVDVVDAVAALEQRGFHRSVAVITLSAEERAVRLDQINRDRLARAAERGAGGRASFEGSATHATIASERIEGIDARPWLRHTREP